MLRASSDAIYHKHFSYFSLVTTDWLAESHGLKIIDVEKLGTHGGSLRVYLAHAASTRRPSPRVSELLEHEIESGFLEIETYARFSEQVRRTKRNLLSFLIAAKEQGKSICGYGAPGRGNTLARTTAASAPTSSISPSTAIPTSTAASRPACISRSDPSRPSTPPSPTTCSSFPGT